MDRNDRDAAAADIARNDFAVAESDEVMLPADQSPTTALKQIYNDERESVHIEQHLGDASLKLENASHTVIVFLSIVAAGLASGALLMWSLLN